MMNLATLLAPLLAATAALAAPAVPRAAVAPADDPFYQPPAGYQNTAPGTILNKRTVQASFLGLVPDPVAAYQLLYRTTATNGTAIATVTTIFVPLNAAKDRFVSFQTAYDSSDTVCDPSYNYQLGAPQTDLISSVEMLLIQGFLTEGYIVSSPDYEGPDAAFTAGHLSGMAVLDSMRAVTNFKDTLGLTTDKPMIVADGYSGGSVGSGWGAALQQSYAPELNVKGWIGGGTVANLTSTLLLIDDTIFSGFLPPAIDGLSKPSAYADTFGREVASIVTPEGRKVLAQADGTCAVEDLGNFFHRSILTTDIQVLGKAILEQPTIRGVLDRNVMGVYQSETPVAPVLMYHALDDEIIPYDSALKTANSWCDYGASVKFVTFQRGGHLTTEILGFPTVLNFTNQAFAGTLEQGCPREVDLSNTLNPIGLAAQLEPIVTALLDVLLDFGDKDSNVIKDIGTLEKSISNA